MVNSWFITIMNQCLTIFRLYIIVSAVCLLLSLFIIIIVVLYKSMIIFRTHDENQRFNNMENVSAKIWWTIKFILEMKGLDLSEHTSSSPTFMRVDALDDYFYRSDQ